MQLLADLPQWADKEIVSDEILSGDPRVVG
jgi:hypothetical protein